MCTICVQNWIGVTIKTITNIFMWILSKKYTTPKIRKGKGSFIIFVFRAFLTILVLMTNQLA